MQCLICPGKELTALQALSQWLSWEEGNEFGKISWAPFLMLYKGSGINLDLAFPISEFMF